MASLNRIVLVGRLTADPERRTTADGSALTKFRLMVNRPFAGPAAENGVDLIDIIAWKKIEESGGQELKKDQLVLVEGRIQVRSYDDQSGQRKWVTEVVARGMITLDKAGQKQAAAAPVASVAREETIAGDPELPNDLPF